MARRATRLSPKALLRLRQKLVDEGLYEEDRPEDTIGNRIRPISDSLVSIKNPDETFHVNVDGTKNLLIACKRNNVKKLIVASSAAVYGEGLENVKLTEDSMMDPMSPYGESKVRMENEIKRNSIYFARESIR